METGTHDPKLSEDDFRARRWYMPADAFALVTGPYEGATDLIPEDEWHKLMSCPTDVLLRTSDQHGSQVAQLNVLWSRWVQTLPLEREAAPYIFNTAWDVADEDDGRYGDRAIALRRLPEKAADRRSPARGAARRGAGHHSGGLPDRGRPGPGQTARVREVTEVLVRGRACFARPGARAGLACLHPGTRANRPIAARQSQGGPADAD